MHLQFQQKEDGFWPNEWQDARDGAQDELKDYALQESDPGNNRIRWRIIDENGITVDTIG